MRHCVSGLALVIAALGSFPVLAQPVISAKSGLISYVEGKVTLNGEAVDFSSTHFQDIKENGVVKTEEGRTEVLLTPGVTLRLGENSSMRMITNRLIDTRVEVLTGSAVVEADEIMKDTSVTVVCKNGTVSLSKAGIYRFNTEPAGLKVFKGSAMVAINGENTPVSSGRMLTLGGESASVQKFDDTDTDSLDRWSHRRGGYLAMANASAANGLVSSGVMPSTWGMNGCSSAWGYNSWLGMMTYIPCNGMLMSPYGYQFWSPYAISRLYWYGGSGGFFGGGGNGGFHTGSGGLIGNAGALSRPAASAALSRGSSSAVSSAASAGMSHGIAGGAGAPAGPSGFGNRGGGGGFPSAAAPAVSNPGGGFNGGSIGGGGGGAVSSGGGAAAGGGGHGGGSGAASGGHH